MRERRQVPYDPHAPTGAAIVWCFALAVVYAIVGLVLWSMFGGH